MRLEPEDVEAIARRVAELLSEAHPDTVRLVDAAALAGRLGVERDWVYAHAADLGAIRLGGPQGRLRFDLVEVRRRLAAEDSQPAGTERRERTRQPRSRSRAGVELLPYEES